MFKYYITIISLLINFNCSNKREIHNISHNNALQNKSSITYHPVDLKCTSSDDFISTCSNQEGFESKINYDNNHIEFCIQNKFYQYSFGNTFEGIATRGYLYKGISDMLYIVEFSYEYTSKLLLFQIQKDNLFFIRSVEFEMGEGDYFYSISQINKNNIKINKIIDKMDSSQIISFDDRFSIPSSRNHCNISSKASMKSKKLPSCTIYDREMEREEKCLLYHHSSLQKAYEEIIKNKLIDDTEHLLPNIPKNNESIEIQSELIIDYKIKENIVEIDMIYPGGVTSISLEKKDTHILRKIIRSAN